MESLQSRNAMPESASEISTVAQRVESELRHASKETLVETVAIIVEDKIKGTTIFESHAEDTIPRFGKSELRLGKVLGRGGFCVVTAIDKVKISEINSKGSSFGSNSFLAVFRKQSSETDATSNGSRFNKATTTAFLRESLSRTTVAQLARKKNRRGGRFALKRVSTELGRMGYLKGIVDLAMEAKFLAELDHPNIISLCGISSKGATDFIMVERLIDTLSSKLKTWTQIDRQCKGITGILTGSRRKEAELYEAKIAVAYDVACVVRYLHARNIIFRDLKPDNIGFDLDGNVKVFDFGLAKELMEKDRAEHGLYKLTSMTGALRYMAPEVSVGEPYNLAADIYSISMIMWFILALEPPFGFYTEDMIKDRVHQRGSRPALFTSWSKPIGTMMKRAWDRDVASRPDIDEVCTVLKTEMCVSEDATANTSTGTSGFEP